MALETKSEITTAIEQAVNAERETIFKLICPFCAEENAPVRLKGRHSSAFAWWHWAEDAHRRKHCKAASLREWMQLPNPASQLLAAQISRISERISCQAWLCDIEFNLWTVLKNLNLIRGYGFEEVTDAEFAALKRLKEQANGWIYWDIYDRAFKFVSFSDWEKVYATKLDRYISIPDEFEQILQTVPQEVLEQLPSDSSEQHDHYIHGASRRE